jgi:hypothetical protein
MLNYSTTKDHKVPRKGTQSKECFYFTVSGHWQDIMYTYPAIAELVWQPAEYLAVAKNDT